MISERDLAVLQVVTGCHDKTTLGDIWHSALFAENPKHIWVLCGAIMALRVRDALEAGTKAGDL